MSHLRVAALLLILPASLIGQPILEQRGSGEPDTTPVPVVKLAPQSASPPSRALRYRLLPDRADLQHGNAAPMWLRAGLAAREVQKRLNDDWSDTAVVPLKDLPRKDVREALAGYATALRWAEQAAQRDHCSWELPAVDFHNFDFPYSELQDLRLLANILNARCRLELSEGKFDQAAGSLRIGLILAQHVGDGDTLIQALVGNAIATVMFGRVEEWMQIPSSPNLYWALTALPVPFLDGRHAIEFEMNNLVHMLPPLRHIRTESLAPEHTAALVTEMMRLYSQWGGEKTPEWQVRLGMAIYAAKIYPDARRRLLTTGYSTERLNSMSPVQIVLVYFLDQNDQFRDEVLKVLSLPSWQARTALDEVSKEVRRLKQQVANPFLPLLFPAIEKVYEARIRLERGVASLRCAEALRLYAASHHGKAPDKLSDITTVPLPLDPFTGKGFEGFYQAKNGHGVLEVPSIPPSARHAARRFEIGLTQ